MLFPSIEFAIFLSGVLVVSWGRAKLGHEELRKWYLLIVSLGFYAFWSWQFALLLVAVSSVAYAVGMVARTSDNAGQKRLADCRRRWAVPHSCRSCARQAVGR